MKTIFSSLMMLVAIPAFSQSAAPRDISEPAVVEQAVNKIIIDKALNEVSANEVVEESKKEVVRVAPKSEAEIPVLTQDTKKEAKVEVNPLSRLGYGILIVVSLMGAGVLILKKWKAPSKGKGSPHTIRVLGQSHLSPKRSLYVVQVAGEAFLLGVTDQSIQLIKELALLDDEIPQQVPQQFQNAMEKIGPSGNSTYEEEGDDFYVGGLGDIVKQKLKGLGQFK